MSPWFSELQEEKAKTQLGQIEAVKGGRAYVHVEQPLVIFQTAGVYTEEVRAVYG